MRELEKEFLKEKIRDRIIQKGRKGKYIFVLLGFVLLFFAGYLLKSAILSANIWLIAWDVLLIFTSFVLIGLGLRRW